MERIKTSMQCITVLFMMLLLTACSVSSKKTLAISQSSSQVEQKAKELIFGEEQKEETKIEQFPSSFAILPFQNLTSENEASSVMRRVLQGHLSTKNYQFVHWKKVDEQLTAAQISPDEIVARLDDVMATLGVDGVLTGKVTTFERFYAGVYAHIKLGVSLEMHNDKQQKLWQQDFEVTTRAGGVSLTVWGNLLNAALASMHLQDENLYAAADELGRKVYQDIPQPPAFSGQSGPSISGVLHDGASKVLRYGDIVKIGLRGESNMRATAVIEGVGSFDLVEKEPGVYIGDVPVSKNWNLQDAMITGRLTDNKGSVSQWISPTGLLNVDNVAPSTVSGLETKMITGGVRISWSGNGASTSTYKVYSYSNGTASELLSGSKTSVEVIEGLSQFEEQKIGITAIDEAGNESQPTMVNVTFYPIDDMQNAQELDKLPATIEGPVLLTKKFSPYTVESEITISSTGALYLLPGVELIFSNGGKLNVIGEMHSWKHTQPVTLRAKDKDKASTFISISSKKNIKLAGLNVEHAGIGFSVNNGNLSLSESSLTGSLYSAISVDGSSNVSVDKVAIDGSNTSGVVIAGRAKVKISDTSFSNNSPFHIQSSSIYPVNAEGNQWQPEASATNVLGDVRY